MASTTATATLPLAFSQVHFLSQRQVFAEFHHNRISVSSSSPSSVAWRWRCDSKRVYAKAVSTDRGGPQNALSEEVVETQSSELKDNSESTPSSSKMVLVVGASGGVGETLFTS